VHCGEYRQCAAHRELDPEAGIVEHQTLRELCGEAVYCVECARRGPRAAHRVRCWMGDATLITPLWQIGTPPLMRISDLDRLEVVITLRTSIDMDYIQISSALKVLLWILGWDEFAKDIPSLESTPFKGVLFVGGGRPCWWCCTK
jgi:hypothetical protein